MRTMMAALTLGALLVTTGCSSEPSEPSAPQLPAIENFVGDAQSEERVAGYAEAVEASYLRLYESGMREDVTSAGDQYILSYAPQEKFYAGLYHVEIEDVVVIEQEELFTVASAYLALQDPTTVVTESDAGISISNEEYGDFTIVIENGLVVSAFDNYGTWEGTFSYEPDEEVTRLVNEILAEVTE